ncbi:MAG: FHA domain-containing protein [Chiayiivirga sp.]|jgi:pSer/pThr/pTyr-binding forkhead associated (FHA) protein|nr:FHA domain-containing protein [Chiayiivirga sp.]
MAGPSRLLDPITIGRAANAGIRLDEPGMEERHATLEQHADRVVLRDQGSHDGSVVNGVELKDAVLHPGDQIAFEQHRFVLEAPGLPPRGTGRSRRHHVSRAPPRPCRRFVRPSRLLRRRRSRQRRKRLPGGSISGG